MASRNRRGQNRLVAVLMAVGSRSGIRNENWPTETDLLHESKTTFEMRLEEQALIALARALET